MQNWLKLKDEWKNWNEKTLNQITVAFPRPKHENRAVWMMYLPHAKSAITAFKTSFGEARDPPWKLLHSIGESSRITGKYAEAEAMYRQLVQLKGAVLGKDHPDTLICMMGLALSLNQQGKHAEAEAMHQQTLQLQETVLGKDHPDTLMSMCPFCIGDESKSYEQRIGEFCRPATMMNHVENIHLKGRDPEAKMECFHPICKSQGLVLKKLEYFKSHVELVHKITLRR